jgi:hypothetical protein
VLRHLRDLDARFGIFREYARHQVLELWGEVDIGGVGVLHVDNLLHHLAIQGSWVYRVLQNQIEFTFPGIRFSGHNEVMMMI